MILRKQAFFHLLSLLLRSMMLSSSLGGRTLAHRSSCHSAAFIIPTLRRRLSSTLQEVFSSPILAAEDSSLLDPAELCPVLPYPAALSPSSIAEFLACPQSFLFQYLFRIKQPTSLALLKGRLCHTALEQLYDLEPKDRTLPHLQNLFRKAYGEKRDQHLDLFDSPQAERKWGLESLELLANYMNTEDPTLIQPAQREIWVQSHFYPHAEDSASSIATTSSSSTCAKEEDNSSKFLVRGIVDRLDLVRPSKEEETDEPVVMAIIDYKTSKQPHLKYTKSVNQRIRDQTFFQLQIYALLLHEQQQRKNRQINLPIRYLRLLYLNSPHNRADAWTLDMGATSAQRHAYLQETKESLVHVWKNLTALIDQQDPTAFVGCQRSFCYCHSCRPRFVPGTVWEP